MTTALVVEDDDGDMAAIEGTLGSMQHRFERTTNQADALRLAAERNFDYAIVDLRIPARPDRSHADVEFGGNLLRDLRQQWPESQLPVIVMADDVNCFGMARWLIDKGASEFVSKPFQTTHELGDIIRRVLRRIDRPVTLPLTPSEQSPQSFTGGELVMSHTEASLLGVPIVAQGCTGHCLNILRHLAQRGADGKYICRSAEDLANAIDVFGGQTAVAGYVRIIRTNSTERLRKSQGIECRRNDVIERTPSGYRFRDWITTRWEASPTGPEVAESGVSLDGSLPGLNTRQAWVIEQLSHGKPFERKSIEKRFRVHEKTAKRDLTELSRLGMIEYVRDGQGGGYRLLTTRQTA